MFVHPHIPILRRPFADASVSRKLNESVPLFAIASKSVRDLQCVVALGAHDFHRSEFDMTQKDRLRYLVHVSTTGERGTNVILYEMSLQS